MMKPKGIRARALLLAAAVTFLTLLAGPQSAVASARPDAEEEVRAAMRQAFERLQSGDFGGVYDALPTASQRRVGRQQFVQALERSRGMFTLNGLEIERVSVAGNLAAVDTVIYASVRQPLEAEGKIVARQYMVREGGRWRVTTGDRSTVRPLLAANPAFSRQFPPTEPRIYIKRDGRWVNLSALQGARTRK
jgi:hypothetical protein